MATASYPSDFGRQLRQWRTHRGLSQLELATRAGTTSRHLSFLETGRSRPRSAMVMRLARELDVPLREQNAMLLAAGLSAIFPERSLDDIEMEKYRSAIDSLLEAHEPLPAAVVDRYGSVRFANTAFELLAPGLLGLEPEEMVDVLFGPGPVRDSLMNWTEVAPIWLERQNREARRTRDPRLASLISRAEARVGPGHPLPPSDSAPMLCSKFKLGNQILELFAVVVRFDSALDVSLSALRIELLYPANEAAEDFFLGRDNASRSRP
jgi:transcriptional regulator with XRE-family HTH domain